MATLTRRARNAGTTGRARRRVAAEDLGTFVGPIALQRRLRRFVLVALALSVAACGPAPLIAFGLLFASSYFSVITPQGGSQNIIFAASGYLTQRELYRLGLVTTIAFLAVFLLVGIPWVLFVTG